MKISRIIKSARAFQKKALEEDWADQSLRGDESYQEGIEAEPKPYDTSDLSGYSKGLENALNVGLKNFTNISKITVFDSNEEWHYGKVVKQTTQQYSDHNIIVSIYVGGRSMNEADLWGEAVKIINTYNQPLAVNLTISYVDNVARDNYYEPIESIDTIQN